MLRGTVKSILASIIMFIVIMPISLNNLFLSTMVKVFVGILTYIIVMFILKSEIQKDLIKRVLKSR